VILGIDGGGTSVVARAVRGGEIVHEGCGGPGNLAATDAEALVRHLDRSLAGCPPPAAVGACFAGYSSFEGRALLHAHLSRRFPRAAIRVAPDHVAALLATAPEADMCCIAGTGSLCCSLVEGRALVSGGGGHLLGDRGSAARYGRAAVELAFALGPRRTLPSLSVALARAYGTTDVVEVARRVYASPSPAAVLGRLAPHVVAAAEEGQGWATVIVEDEVAALAATAGRHIDDTGIQNGTGNGDVRVALVGGVWHSDLLRVRFAEHLAALRPSTTLTVDRSAVAPVAGAVMLAGLQSGEAERLGY
jgi:N-acetylglucosamine kinase-like BadF-type ATPase